MEEQQNPAGEQPSRALTPPEGQSVEGMQQAINPDASVANASVQPPPSMGLRPRKPPNRFDICIKSFMKSFMIGLRKLWILLWKNMLLRGRSWILLTLQVIIIVGIWGLINLPGSAGRSSAGVEDKRDPIKLSQAEMIGITFGRIYWLSKNDAPEYGKQITEKIADFFTAQAQQQPSQAYPLGRINWEHVQSEKDIEGEYGRLFANDGNAQNFWGAVIFEKLSSTEVKYTIRPTSPEGINGNRGGSGTGPQTRDPDSDTVEAPYDTSRLFGDSEPGPNKDHETVYKENGILGLQLLIDDAAIKVLHKNTLNGDVGLKREITLKTFPYPPHKPKNVFKKVVLIFFCCAFLFYLAFSNPFLSMNIGNEKVTGVKELMKLCGYPGWMQWLAWYLIMFLVDLICLVLLQAMLTWIPVGIFGEKRPFLEHSQFVLSLFIFLLTMISNNAFIIFICSIVRSTSLSTFIVIVLPFAIAVPVAVKESTSFSTLMAVSLLPNACFVNAMRYIFEFEGDGHGAQWNMLDETIPNVPKLNLGLIILMFLIDIVLYQSLAVYIEAILPSEYGVRKPVYYPIQPLITPIIARVRRKRKAAPTPSQTPVPQTVSNTKGFEPDPGQGKMVGVEVRNIVKKFDGHKIAVNGVSLKMYDGEIFALLGHNGAGKTTLISTLTGLFAPTSGTATVGGYDITNDLDKVRQSLGLCPQHDMLFNNLTVMEHLQIFGRMKGQSASKVKQEAMQLLSIMNLAEKRNTVSKKLSGGQKRKLCLGMALIGEAKVVILDEPTSGMDPEARRAIWDILLQVRGKRTILLTTHFMEEADVLGDRIGIMAEGKLQCCGSPSFLKTFYGTGYTLKTSLLPGADKNAILELVQKSIPDASLKPINMPNEIFISLPTETASSSALSSLFSALTDKKDEMRIESLGLSVASMDEIFVKVGELSEKAAVEAKEDVGHSAKSPKSKASVHTHSHTHKKPRDVRDVEGHHESATIAEVPVPTLSEVEAGVQPVGNDPNTRSSAALKPTSSTGAKSTTPSAARASSKQIRVQKRSKLLASFMTCFKTMCKAMKMTLVQAVAILIKRFICTIRKIGFLLFQIFVPASLALGAVLFINGDVDPGPIPPPLKIGLDDYKNPLILYSAPQNLISAASKAIGPSSRKVGNVERALWDAAKEDISFYREHIIAAGEIVSDTSYTAWFNTIPLHAAPLAINLASNIRGREFNPPIKFTMTNHPLKTRGATLLKAAVKIASEKFFKIMAWDLAGCMTTALLLFAIFYVVLPTEERLNKSRQLQLMTGIHPLTYWGTYFLWDFVVLLIVTTFMIGIIGILQSFQIFTSYGGLGAIFLVCLAYGSASIPLAYLISGIPKSVAGGVTILVLFILIPYFVTLFLTIGLEKEAVRVIQMILCRIVPLAGASMSLYQIGSKFHDNGKCNLLRKNELEIICTQDFVASATASASAFQSRNGYRRRYDVKHLWPCCENCTQISGVTCFKPESYVKWVDGDALGTPIPGVGQIALCNFVMFIVFLGIHIMIELGIGRLIRRLLARGITTSDFLAQVDDEDVRIEEHRVAEMIMTKNTSADALVVDTLCKNYGGLSAVSKLTFGVHHGECFGLLGTNGAGKTTTFRMITGDELPSLGDVHEGRFSLQRNHRKLISQIGYCPQFDAFIPYLTGKENLQLFARLRGIPWRQVNKEAAKFLESVGLTASGNVKCKKYSGGMKRRLSAAIALIGNPALILLDEPTSGVDPVSRRQFWKVLEAVKGQGQSIILTSHSMDECEALCARLGIMVNGQLQCIGGVQHLKHKFAQGYTLTLRLKSITDPQMQQQAMGLLGALNNEISEKFHPCMLKDQHETVLQYQIENTTLGWNVIYNNLEELKKSYGDIIEDYSVSETSLEEVFLAFSRKQYPPRDSKIPLCRRIWTCQY